MIEPMDVYNANKELTGKCIDRFNDKLGEGEYFLNVLVVIQDAQGKYLVTRRSLDKHWGAGWWEVTGGGAAVGETSLQAAQREVSEEVGLAAGPENFELIFSYSNYEGAGGDNYHMDIYRAQLDFTRDQVVLQESEAIDCALLTWEEIKALQEQGVFLHFSRLERALGK